MTASTISTILGLDQEDVASSLSRLESVLHVQEGPSGLVSILHASFPDFLCNEARSSNFYCNIVEHNTKLAHSCFDVMCKELHFNMCDLKSSYDFDEDIPDLEQKIQANISAALLYACKYWSNHLVRCDLTSSIHYRLVEFLKFRFLFWMEVLNLAKSITIGPQMLSNTLAWFICKAPEHRYKQTEKELYDTDFFVKTFSLGACKKSTPHIYISALPFCFKSNSVYQNYWSKTNGLMVVDGTSLTQQRNGPLGVWKSGSRVNTVAFSPDGNTFASGSLGGVLDIRDVQSGEMVFSHSLEDRGSILVVVFSPDNFKMATGSKNGDVRIWDVQTASLIATRWPSKKDESSVFALAFSGDSEKLALYSGSTLVVWDLSSGEVIFGPFESGNLLPYSSIAFTLDDAKILFVSDIGMVHVLNVHTGSDLAEPIEATEDAGQLTSTAISPDRTMFAVGYDGGTIYIWDTHAGTTMHGPFTGHNGRISALVFSHDGKEFVSGSYDKTIRIWDIDTGDVVAGPFEGHTGSILSLALSSDGTKIVSGSGSSDCSVRLWNVSATSESDIVPPCQSVTGGVDTVAWSPDGQRIASKQYDGTVVVWSAENGEAAVIEPFSYSPGISSIAFSPDGSRISAGTRDGNVASWDSRTGKMVGKPFQGHSNVVTSIAYSPDGSMMASGSEDHTIIIRDCSTGKMIGKPLGHDIAVDFAVAFTPDGNRLISAVVDHSIYVWNVHTGQIILGPIKGHKGPILSIACSPDRPLFVSRSTDGALRVWSMTTGRMAAGPFYVHCGDVTSIAYSRDGTKIISGFANGTICVLDAKTGNILASIAGHTDHVAYVAVSLDGSKLTSGSWDKSIRVWQLDTILTSSESLRNAPTIWMPKNVIIPTISNIARYQDDGWVVLDDLHLFWTSPEFREDLCYPYNPIVIGPHGTTRIDYSVSKLFIGQMWSRCWIYGREESTSQ
ncbi:WD40 repeat-like protein [Agrocybe pediades]|nr:WD40 repeat-like protein [Agrocybe pediades]